MVMRNYMCIALIPILRPEFVERGEHLRLLRKVCVQCDSRANGVLFIKNRLAKGTVAETRIIKEVNAKILSK
jgi:hypothetical protein